MIPLGSGPGPAILSFVGAAGPHPAWGDVAAWVTAAVAFLAFGAGAFREQSEEKIMPLVRASTRAGFVFTYEADSNPDAKITTRFTDDAGLHWQIDPDLHLQKLDSRDDW